MNTKPTKETHALISPGHLRRLAVVYCRHSTEQQAEKNTGGLRRQRSLAEVARSYGWPDSQIEIIDDSGRSGSSAETREGWKRLQEVIDAGQVGAVFAATVSRLSRQVMEFELFRLRAALHNTLLYTDRRFIDLAGERDRIVSKLISFRDSGARSGRRSARAKKQPRPLRGQNSGRGKKR